MSEDLVLVPEVQARRVLRGRSIRLRVLAPYGSWIGCGRLRVLRLILQQGHDSGVAGDGAVELTVGYESYRA
ncbi:MAG TPA: hypothetical protein VFF63_06060 [Candidatus Babeliales bacterium]|nr:hypothetical protein [Candidatus Babeliales bacterium]